MAQKILTLFEDDLDGSKADGTIAFAIDGADYEIDLNAEHADALRGVFAPYLAVARKISYAKPTRRGSRATRQVTGPDNSAVREWAKTQGIEVKERGRIPVEIIQQYDNRDKQAGNGHVPDTKPEVTLDVPPTTFKAADPEGEEKTPRKRAPRKSKAE